MIVVSDTTAISNLQQIDLLWVLPALYETIYIPSAVYRELARLASQKQLVDQSDWINVREIHPIEIASDPSGELDPGEAEAIALAIELKADLLIIDERKGRRVAKQHGLRIIGVLGILIDAKRQQHIAAAAPYLKALVHDVGFYLSDQLYQEVLDLLGEK